MAQDFDKWCRDKRHEETINAMAWETYSVLDKQKEYKETNRLSYLLDKLADPTKSVYLPHDRGGRR